MFVLAALVIGGLVAAGEYLLARRGLARPWIYAWAVVCPVAGVVAAIWCVERGLGTAWAIAVALLVGGGAYPVGRTLFEYWRTTQPRYRYLDDLEEPPLTEPTYQTTDFGGSSTPLRPERPEPVGRAVPAPRLIAWREALGREGLAAAAVSLAVLALGLELVTTAWPRPWWSPADHVAAVLADEGFPLASVRRAETGNACAAGRETSFHWSAPGATGEACRSRGGRVSYWVTRRWPAERR